MPPVPALIFLSILMSALKKIGFGSVAFVTAIQQSYAIDFGGSKVADSIKGSADTADVTVQNLVSKAMVFLGIIAVLYGLWGGFNILTAGGDDDKVKKGKTILIQAGIGLVVIFLANSIVQFVLNNILG